MEKKTFLIYGISKGLGKAMTVNLPDSMDKVFGISRSKPDYLEEKQHVHWIETNLAESKTSVDHVKAVIGQEKIDYLIYNVGIWDSLAFTDQYDFENSSVDETLGVINTNVASCLLHIQAMLSNLKQSANAKIILIGSTWGLENHNGKEVAYSTTKFALRGIVNSLRENLRKYQIGISIINLGHLATYYEDNQSENVMEGTDGKPLPLQDVIAALRFIISTSNASCVKEIDMPAMNDLTV